MCLFVHESIFFSLYLTGSVALRVFFVEWASRLDCWCVFAVCICVSAPSVMTISGRWVATLMFVCCFCCAWQPGFCSYRCHSWCVQTGLLQPSVAAALGVSLLVSLKFWSLCHQFIFESFPDYSDHGGPPQHWTGTRTNIWLSCRVHSCGSCMLAGCGGKW